MVEPVASVPDLLRLLSVPVLGWAAWQDLRIRRVPSRVWWPLIGLGVVLLAWEGVTAMGQSPAVGRLYLVRVGVSVGVLVPLAVVFSRLHLIGGADAKAFAALAVLFPTYPVYEVGTVVLPLVRPPLGVFSLTAITNGAILGLLYPVVLSAANVVAGEWSPAMVRATRVGWTALPSMHGRLAETPDGRTLRGLDLDALRMYLRWRRTSLPELRERPHAVRDPSTVPDPAGEPTDGRVDPDERLDSARSDPVSAEEDPFADGDAWTYEDPWAAEEFLSTVGGAYGTTPDQLREGLELLSQADRVWVSPGLPYLVPVFAGLAVGLALGDVLYVLLRVAGVG